MGMPFCQGTKYNSWLFQVVMVTDLWPYVTYNLRGAWHTLSRIISELLPKIIQWKKYDYLKPVVPFQIL